MILGMRSISRRGLMGAGLATLLPGGKTPSWSAEAASVARFRRGASIFSLLGWGKVWADDKSRYVEAPFAADAASVPDLLLRRAAAAGFDFIRLAVDPGPFIQLTGAPRDRLDGTLLAAVRRLRRFGFSVLVDIHPNGQIPAYNSYGYTDSIDSAGFRNYAALIRRTAKLLEGLGDPAVALELMNEPPNEPDPANTARWQAMLERFHAAAREGASRLPLVLAGAQADLPALDPAPFKGSNVFYTFHYYEPHDFTHQGVPAGEGEDDYRRYLVGLPYPAKLLHGETQLVLNAIAANPALEPAARARILTEAVDKARAYRSSGFDRSHIATDFRRIADWAAAHGIAADRILLGEFGVARSFQDHPCADPISANLWLKDVRQEAEAQGFGWSIWALTGGTFMRVTTAEGSTVLDPQVLAALGLKNPERN